MRVIYFTAFILLFVIEYKTKSPTTTSGPMPNAQAYHDAFYAHAWVFGTKPSNETRCVNDAYHAQIASFLALIVMAGAIGIHIMDRITGEWKEIWTDAFATSWQIMGNSMLLDLLHKITQGEMKTTFLTKKNRKVNYIRANTTDIPLVIRMDGKNVDCVLTACFRQERIFIHKVLIIGSLTDVMVHHDVNFGWKVRHSMIRDVYRGVAFIVKSEIGSHGNLRYSNCLVDEHLRITLGNIARDKNCLDEDVADLCVIIFQLANTFMNRRKLINILGSLVQKTKQQKDKKVPKQAITFSTLAVTFGIILLMYVFNTFF